MRKTFQVSLLASMIGVSLLGGASVSMVSAEDVSGQTSGTGRYMIEFTDDGALYYAGGIANLRGSAPDPLRISRKFDATSQESQDYRAYLRTRQQEQLAGIAALLGHPVEVTHTFEITQSGVAAKLTAAEAAVVSRAPGVKSVKQEEIYQLDTYRGPAFIGAETVWNLAVPGGPASRGKGVTVGVLDSGANSTHPSFADDASCGFGPTDHKLLSAVDCSATTAGLCTGPNAEAVDSGHGVHTASTAAGNTVTNAATPSPALPSPYTQMSGVAPCASLRTYKVCPGSTCPGADILGGVNSAIANSVDVINFSISGGTSPWSDNDRNFLDAINADIVVAASAGNTSTTITNPVGQVNHRGPWMMTVAASTQDVNLGSGLSATGPGTPPADTQNLLAAIGSHMTAPVPFANLPIRVATTNALGCTVGGGFPANYFSGAVALISRGTCAFSEKVNNAAAAGAVQVVIYNNTFGTISMDTTGATIPAYSIRQSAGVALSTFITANGATPTTASLSAAIAGAVQGDVLADFSFRGPTPGTLADLTKPDITGPGVNIYAAGRAADGNYFTISGTSMSSPHLAGSAALVRAVRPSWTPTEVKSALLMTAKRAGFKENGTDSWNVDDVGSGRVDLTKATSAGLVMDETGANFLAANPSGGTINIKTLNLPSVRNVSTCTPDCTFTRTVKSTLATSSTWNVSFETPSNISAVVTPATFTLTAGATQALTIVVTPGAYGPPLGAPNPPGSGYIVLTEATAQSPAEHITVAVRGARDGIFKDGFETGFVASTTQATSFDDITTLAAAGWTLVNRSATTGSTTWFQGNPAVFEAQAGDPTAYIGANFNSTTGSNTISTWLISPIITFSGDSAFSFYTRSSTASPFPDRLEVRLCTVMPCTDLGVVATGTGAFGTLVKSINPTLATLDDPTGNAGYPLADWAQFSFDTSSAVPLPTSGQGRIAMRYFVTAGGPSGANSNFIGIDTLSITAAAITPTGVPSPSGVTNNPAQSGKR